MAMKERIAGGEVDLEVRGVGELGDLAGIECGDQQPEASDRNRIGVDVDAGDLIERSLAKDPDVLVRLSVLPVAKQALKGGQEEVPGAAGGVDQVGLGKAELTDRRLEGVIQNEALDEVRGLQQRVALLCIIGEVLVE